MSIPLLRCTECGDVLPPRALRHLGTVGPICTDCARLADFCDDWEPRSSWPVWVPLALGAVLIPPTIIGLWWAAYCISMATGVVQ